MMDGISGVGERVLRVLEDLVLQGKTIEEDATWGQLGFDSLDKIDFLMDLEDEFDVDLPDAIMQYLDTVGEVIEYFEKKFSEN